MSRIPSPWTWTFTHLVAEHGWVDQGYRPLGESAAHRHCAAHGVPMPSKAVPFVWPPIPLHSPITFVPWGGYPLDPS
jgi:hypothetical protein